MATEDISPLKPRTDLKDGGCSFENSSIQIHIINGRGTVWRRVINVKIEKPHVLMLTMATTSQRLNPGSPPKPLG